MNMAKAAGMTEMDMALIQGSMVSGQRGTAKAIGLFTHLVVMSAVVFGIIYGLLFSALGIQENNAWWVGALFGAIHGMIAGMAFAMMPAMHPRMGKQPKSGSRDGELQLAPPGLFGKNYGSMTPAGVLMAHIVFGLVLGFVYGLLV